MSVQPFIPWLLAAFVPAVVGQVVGARVGSAWLSGTAALLITLMSILVAMKVNRPYWAEPAPPASKDVLAEATRRNARLIAWTWAGGAASMLAVYLLSGLRWQHGWQYGGGMLLIANLAFLYSLNLGLPQSPLRQPRLLTAAAMIAAAQGIAAIGGIMVLVMSGKVMSHKADWAANIVFVAGGFAITVLSAIAVRTHACISPDDKDDRRES